MDSFNYFLKLSNFAFPSWLPVKNLCRVWVRGGRAGLSMARHKSPWIHNSLETREKDKTRWSGSLKTAFPQVCPRGGRTKTCSNSWVVLLRPFDQKKKKSRSNIYWFWMFCTTRKRNVGAAFLVDLSRLHRSPWPAGDIITLLFNRQLLIGSASSWKVSALLIKIRMAGSRWSLSAEISRQS